MSNLYDYAYNLEKMIRNNESYKKLQSSYDSVLEDQEAYKLFKKFRDTQLRIQEKNMRGEEISEDESKRAEDIVNKVQNNHLIQQLIENEQHFNLILSEISQIITKPLEEIYKEFDSKL